nr:EOG090X0DHL [Eulimnadia texana]
MFLLAEMKQTVRVLPEKFNVELVKAIGDELNRKLANKVVLNVGLCIALWDITKQEESYILPGDGASHTKVHFRYVVFRPFMEQVIIGKVKNSSREGVQVTLGFFDDIYISAENMQHPSRFDENEHLWLWEYQTDEGKHDLYMDVGEEIRFRVIAETFTDTTPTGPKTETAEGERSENKPYSIAATINEPGLGLLSWWTG